MLFSCSTRKTSCAASTTKQRRRVQHINGGQAMQHAAISKSGKLLTLLFATIIGCWSEAVSAAGGSGQRFLSRVFVENGRVYIHADGAWGNPDGCGVSTFGVVQPTTPSQEYFLSAALTALTARKEISLWFSGCASGWGTTHPIITRIDVFD